MVTSNFGLKSLLETNKTNNFQYNPSFLIFRLTSTKQKRPLNNQFFSKQLGRVRKMVASYFGLKFLLETNKTNNFQ